MSISTTRRITFLRRGPQGPQGPQGPPGVAAHIFRSSVCYHQSEDYVQPDTIPNASWDASFPDELFEGWWLYTRVYIQFTDGHEQTSYSASLAGKGSYFAGIEEWYCLSSDGVEAPMGYPDAGSYNDGDPLLSFTHSWEQNPLVPDSTKRYLWNCSVSYDSSGHKYVTSPVLVCEYQPGVQSVTERYANSASATAGASGYPSDIAESRWQTSPLHALAVPTQARPYQWNKTESVYSLKMDGTVTSRRYTYTISAIRGGDGQPGPEGRGISHQTTYWRASQYADAAHNPREGVEWTDNPLSDRARISPTYRYLWSYTATTYDHAGEGQSLVEYTTPALVGTYGEQGVPGEQGGEGRGVGSISYYYMAGGSPSTAPAGEWATSISASGYGPQQCYLWSYMRIEYTQGPAWQSSAAVVGVWGRDGQRGARGAVMRGPQVWQEVEDGYTFESGAEGQQWLDVVLYGGQYWMCTASHQRTPQRIPSAQSSYWQAAQHMDLVATRVLLSDHAFIGELRADSVRMTDPSTGLALFRAEGGEVECNTGIFRGATFSTSVGGTGERVDISPQGREISIYGHGGELCTKIGGQSPQSGTLCDAVPRQDITLLPAAEQYTLFSPYSVSGIVVGAGAQRSVSVPISQAVSVAQEGEITIPAWPEPNWNDHHINMQMQSQQTGLSGRLSLMLRTYTTQSCTTLAEGGEQEVSALAISAPSATWHGIVIGTRTMMAGAGWHRLELVATLSGGAEQCTASISLRCSIKKAWLQVTGLRSQYMANGWSVVKNSDNLFLALYEQRTMHILARSGGHQYELWGGTLRVDGAKQPVTLLHLKVSDSASIPAGGHPSVFAYTSMRPINGGVPQNVVVEKLSAVGQYRVNIGHQFPIDGSSCAVRVQGFFTPVGSNQEGASTQASVKQIAYTGVDSQGQPTNTQITIQCSDHNTLRYGSFYLEVVKYYA